MTLDGIRHKVFMDRYSLKDEEGVATEQTPDAMWARVARGIAEAEKKPDRKKWEKEFYRVMDEFKFVPAGRILSVPVPAIRLLTLTVLLFPLPKIQDMESLKRLDSWSRFRPVQVELA